METNIGGRTSRARFITTLRHLDDQDEPLNCDVYINQTILRFLDGQLHCQCREPSVDAGDGHWEFHREGALHRLDGPAVIDDWGNWGEWWFEGQLEWAGPMNQSGERFGKPHLVKRESDGCIFKLFMNQGTGMVRTPDERGHLVIAGLSFTQFQAGEPEKPAYMALGPNNEEFFIDVAPLEI